MIKKGFMKKVVLILISAAIVVAAEAKKQKDPVVMTVAGNDIPMSEFIFIAKKDNSVNLKDKKSVAEYVKLFVNYKLKVADAIASGIDKESNFDAELAKYKEQLSESFLSDKAGEEAAMYFVYERSQSIPGFKYIAFRSKKDRILPKDTVDLYLEAKEVYDRIMKGESFESIGQSVAELNRPDSLMYGVVDYVYPLQMQKVIEDKVFTMEPGQILPPLRSMAGFHLLKLDRVIPNPGQVRVAHILIGFPQNNPTEEEKAATLSKADSIHNLLVDGQDFEELAKIYSTDTVTGRRGGVLKYFGLGEMVASFEKAAFALENVGDISSPVETRFGYHIIKLIDKKTDIAFEEVQSQIYESMRRSERNFDLYRVYDEKLKERHNYVFYPEAYDELVSLANDYFPSDTSFYNRGKDYGKILFRVDTLDVMQSSFVEYMLKSPRSNKLFSLDFMQEEYDLYVRDILMEMERNVLEVNYPEYNQLVKEYYDGMLLFEISNKRVWSQPAEKHDELEAEWIKEITEKYPVTVNWKVINKTKKYL
jgi:peptidyl-prolyl cis-trans isomerase SurA